MIQLIIATYLIALEEIASFLADIETCEETCLWVSD